MPSIPSVTKNFMLACVALFCISIFLRLEIWLALWPLSSGNFWPWQLVSYAFLHADLGHLLFNMLGLWMFGSELERVWGRRRYAQLLLAGALTAALAQLLFSVLMHSNAPTVGASGGLYGLLLSFGMLFPDRIIMPLFNSPSQVCSISACEYAPENPNSGIRCGAGINAGFPVTESSKSFR